MAGTHKVVHRMSHDERMAGTRQSRAAHVGYVAGPGDDTAMQEARADAARQSQAARGTYAPNNGFDAAMHEVPKKTWLAYQKGAWYDLSITLPGLDAALNEALETDGVTDVDGYSTTITRPLDFNGARYYLDKQVGKHMEYTCIDQADGPHKTLRLLHVEYPAQHGDTPMDLGVAGQAAGIALYAASALTGLGVGALAAVTLRTKSKSRRF